MANASKQRAQIVSLPSLSSQLSSLPQAKSMANLPLYTSPLSGQHAAHSEAKLRRALAHTSSGSGTSYATHPAVSASPLLTERVLIFRFDRRLLHRLHPAARLS
ncbi:hypothetical protein PENSPDRAFT_71707 [Peniophora sp. CONT]|nr:hypothetical protein PENSPDRAFT_71707 [Peniophora sp. CONT]